MSDVDPIAAAPWYVAPCRFLFALFFIVWLGGFTFYAAIVIPTAHRVLGTHLEVVSIDYAADSPPG